jgi:hypothetical protein
LNNICLNEITEKISDLKHNLTESNNSAEIPAKLDNLVHDFSDLLKNAVIGTKALPRSKYTSKKKKKQKKTTNKGWYDDECKVKLKHINSLGRHLQRSPWDKGLQSKIYATDFCEKYIEVLRQKC